MDDASEELGPQDCDDEPGRARLRLHQSWYRATVLGASYGETPMAEGARPLGSVLSRADAIAGRNFITPAIFDVAQQRLAAGSGLDAAACLTDMLSCEALALNLLGPLVEDVDLATDVMRTVLDDVDRVVEVHIAYRPSPKSEYLGDHTAFDGFVGYRRSGGARAFVGVKTMLGGPVAPVRPTERYRELSRRPDAPWRPERFEDLPPDVAWAWRHHLLVEAVRHHPAEPYGHGRLALVYHPGDTARAKLAADYRACLRDPSTSLCDWPLDTLVERWELARPAGPQHDWLEALRLRYVELERSEAAAAGPAAVPARHRAATA